MTGVTGAGSLAQIHFTDQPVIDWRSAATARVDLRTVFHLLLLDKRIFAAPRAFFNISTPMSAKEIDELTSGAESSLAKMRPYIEKTAPDLITG
jgi:glutamate-1-semialdehyde 2,1-aminomutase